MLPRGQTWLSSTSGTTNSATWPTAITLGSSASRGTALPQDVYLRHPPLFERADAAGWEGVRFDTHTSAEGGHERHEVRMTTVIYDPAGLPTDWPDVAAVVLVGRERAVGNASALTGRYYIASHAGMAEELGGLARSHWQIGNGLHWVLDVAFREDESRTRDPHAGANLALLRRVAVSLLKRADAEGSVRTRRFKAAWDDTFLQQVLEGVSADSGFA